MKKTLWIFSLEPIPTRYTCEWEKHIPPLLKSKLHDEFLVMQVPGIQKSTQTTPGAFLNFSDTNYWKSSQLCNFLVYYDNNKTSPNDHFLFTDAWNPTIIQLKYMNDLLGLNWTFHGLYHAGSWDPADRLGDLIGAAPWVRHAEQSFFESFTHNYFATDFHIDMFCDVFGLNKESCLASKKIIRTGWPMEYMPFELNPYRLDSKQNLILFPHRISVEKQPDIFLDLQKQLPQYEFVMCQSTQLTKPEYHNLLGKAKIVFSANLQETLGISTCIEGPILGAIPMVPDRLSYSEIFKNHRSFLYPSEWTSSWDNYILNRDKVVNRLIDYIENYYRYLYELSQLVADAYTNYFSATSLINQINSVGNQQ
jgi:hypothetical protein